MTIGERIKMRREYLNISQDELAKKLGYKSRSSINKIELGINDITQSKIKAIADILETTPAYIMGWEDILESETNDSAEKVQKRDDAITDIILKMRRDENLLDAIKELCELSPEHISSVKAFITVLKQQHINNVK
ncbi:MAG: helix-turn-helix transcriptional regulator [Acutalibacteraceae bacterium]|nr:helix-turn-helix transcriptional regulator [Acutalibacteraceae bacterium]